MGARFLNGADLNGQKLTGVGTPTASTDAATKGYVDANAGGGASPAALLGFLPPVNGYLNVPGVVSSGYNAQANGALYLHPTIVPVAMTLGAFRTKINVGRSGGVGYLRKFGVYSELNGYPNLANLMASASIDDTVNVGGNGNDYSFTAGAITVAPGRYWCAGLVYYTTAPTQVSTITTITSAAFGLPGDNQNAPDAQVRTLRVDGQTDLPTTAAVQTAFIADKSNNGPMLWLKRTA